MIPVLKAAALVIAVAGGVTAGVVHHRHAAVAAGPAVAAAPAVAGPPAVAAAPSQAAGDVLQRAQDAYIHGQYDDAIELARKGMAEQPSKAWRIVGAASCFNKDASGATEAWNALDPKGRKFVEYVCKRNDVTLPDGAPVL
jgi:hypothetical protein